MTSEFENDSQVRVQKRYQAMGGQFLFMAYPQKHLAKNDVEKFFDQAAHEVQRIENKFTDFKPSPFNEINDQAGLCPVVVDDEMWNLLKLAHDFSKQTNGLFDISYASLGHPWRQVKAKGELLSQQQRDYYKGLIDYKKIEYDEKDQSVFLPHKDMRIGFGGVAKGYAVDRAFEVLKQAPMINFYVNGSGDIRVHSASDAPRPWRLGIRNPFATDPTQAAGLIQISNGALVTSGSYVHTTNQKDSSSDHHIVLPQTGGSKAELVSVSIVADKTLTADLLATALMNMSAQQAIDELNQRELIGVLINKSGQSFLSQLALKHFGLEQKNQ